MVGYKVLYSDVNDTSRANSSLVSPKETYAKIKGLKANTNYSFQVLAFTAKGNGAKSVAYFARTFPGIEDIFCSVFFVIYLERVFSNRSSEFCCVDRSRVLKQLILISWWQVLLQSKILIGLVIGLHIHYQQQH